jgi:very-short-patch-repair endonuclease
VRARTSPPAPLPQGEGSSGGLLGQVVPQGHPSPLRRGDGGEVFSRGAGMTDRARALRTNMTDAERKLWAGLRGDRLGVRFRRQLVIDRRYIADFCAPHIGLVVEVDGGQHVGSASDVIRTSYLERRGYTVLRFWNNEVLVETVAVLERVHRTVVELLGAQTSPPSPLPRERGARVSPSMLILNRGIGDPDNRFSEGELG